MNDLYLEHHGILGQKWGIRRYQNPDGTLTKAGKERYGIEGRVSVSNHGDLYDSNGKKLKSRTVEIVSNKIKTDEKAKEEFNKLRVTRNEDYDNLDKKRKELENAKYLRDNKYDEFDSNDTIAKSVRTISDIYNNERIIESLEKDIKEAEKRASKSKRDVNEFIANYANKNINDLKREVNTELAEAKSSKKIAKQNYKNAKKQNNKDYTKLYNYNYYHPVRANFTKEGKAKSNELEDKYTNSFNRRLDARDTYKKAQNKYKEAKRRQYE